MLLNLLMQQQLFFTAMQSDLGMLPYALASVAGGRFIDGAMSKYPLRTMILAALLIFIGGTCLFSLISAMRGYAPDIIPASLLAGLAAPSPIPC